MAEMDCGEFVEAVTDHLESNLDEANERRFADHLRSCDGCDRYIGQMRDTILALRQQPRASLSGDARKSLLASFRSSR
ncbi:zf-HC2 domain-containing protein [Nocardia sp. NPDC003345]